MRNLGYVRVAEQFLKLLKKTKAEGFRRPSETWRDQDMGLYDRTRESGLRCRMRWWFPSWAVAISEATDAPIRQRIDYINYVSESPAIQVVIDSTGRLAGGGGIYELMERDLPEYRPDDTIIGYMDENE